MNTFTVRAPTDAQLGYIAGLCEERGLEPPQVVASKQEASEIIARILGRTYDPGALQDPAPAPGLGAGSIIDSQPSAKEPAPSTEGVSEPDAESGSSDEPQASAPYPTGQVARPSLDSDQAASGSLTSPAPAEPPERPT